MYVLLFPVLIAFLLLASALFAIRRHWVWGVSMFSLAIVLNLYSETMPMHLIRFKAVPQEGDVQLRVLSYNMNGPAGTLNDTGYIYPSVLEFIDKTNADIVFMQEFAPGGCKKFVDAMDERYPFHFKGGDKDNGMGDNIYSRYPLSEPRQFFESDSAIIYMSSNVAHYQNNLRMRVFSVLADVHGRDVCLTYCHMASNEYSVLRRKMSHGEPWVMGVDDYWNNINSGYRRRSKQAEVVRDSLSRYVSADVPILMCGDFNDLSGSYVLRTIQGDVLNDAWWNAGIGFGFTYDAYHLLLRLDHILYSKHFYVQEVTVPSVPFSDHYPIVSDILLQADIKD